MPKFFVRTNQIRDNQIQVLGEDFKHIVQVLRAKVGDEITICNLDKNQSYVTTIQEMDVNCIWCKIEKEIKETSESKIHITLFQALPKADKMEYIIQKNTELGVKKIVPVMMKRCIVKLEEKEKKKKIERWQKIAEAAAKQSGRDIIPVVAYPISITELCKEISVYDLVLLAYEKEQQNTLKAELANRACWDGMKIGIIIGPEGGIDNEEIEKLQTVKTVTLGKRILRTETASVAMVSNIMYEYEM